MGCRLWSCRRRQRSSFGLPARPRSSSRLDDGAIRARAGRRWRYLGEHGIGTTKTSYFLRLEDPAKIRIMRSIKEAFDPKGIFNPGTLLG